MIPGLQTRRSEDESVHRSSKGVALKTLALGVHYWAQKRGRILILPFHDTVAWLAAWKRTLAGSNKIETNYQQHASFLRSHRITPPIAMQHFSAAGWCSPAKKIDFAFLLAMCTFSAMPLVHGFSSLITLHKDLAHSTSDSHIAHGSLTFRPRKILLHQTRSASAR